MKLFEIKEEPPKWMIAESAKNQHIEHLEDLVFNKGFAGAHEALDYIESMRKMLSEGSGSTTKISVKWDGSPSLVCGHDPVDNKFFVGTKSVFNKATPKICKTNQDIDTHYGDKLELSEKLKVCLLYLPKLGIGGVIQGDLMFSHDELGRVDINGEDCYVFTPNTITYAVPVNSGLGKKLLNAKMGIIFHTSYDGDTIAEMRANFGVNLSGLSQSHDVWFDDATYKDYTGIATFTTAENSKVGAYLASTLTTMEKIGQTKFDAIIAEKSFKKTIKPFINKEIRHGTHIGNPHTFIKSFITDYTQELLKDIDTLRGGIAGAAAKKRVEKIKQREDWVADNFNTIVGILAVYKRIIELKHMVLNKLNQLDSIGTFQKTNDGYKVTAPEGFVAIGHDGGAVKLVDRLNFSRTNFLKRR